MPVVPFFPGHNGRVRARSERLHDSRLEVIARRRPVASISGLLGIFPVVVRDDGSIGLVKLKNGIRQKARHPKVA